jgi:ABC-type sulfate transport system permease subunit
VGARLERIRDNPWLAVAVAAGTVLVLAWIGWSIYVASDRGVTEGLGVLIAWPARVAAAALIALPFVAGYFLIRRLSSESRDSDKTSATN